MPVEINGYTEGGLERMRASSEAVMKTVEDGMVTRGAAFVQFPQGCGWWRGLVRRMLLALHGHYRGGLVVASERSVLDDVFSGAPAVEMHVRNTVNIACSERIAKVYFPFFNSISVCLDGFLRLRDSILWEMVFEVPYKLS